jgi:hypothetical protein
MNVNRKGVERPDGACDGELIIADHDMKMVDIIFGAMPISYAADTFPAVMGNVEICNA